MNTSIFDKTEKGREEIATRSHRLPSRLRTLLLLVDGKQTGADLLKKVAGLGLNEASLTDLLDNGFIYASFQDCMMQAVDTQANEVTQREPSGLAVPPDRSRIENHPAEQPPHVTAISHFYSETIKSVIGLRGYRLHVKVKKAGSLEEFRQLREPYVEAVLKAKGVETARSLCRRLDQLLYCEDPA